MRLEELEKKFREEKKASDKKIKELETTVKNHQKKKIRPESLICSVCDFEAATKQGLKTHIKRKHTEIEKETFPKECDFCEKTFETTKDMKNHMKSHSYKETNFKCEDCNFCGKNELSMEVHFGKNHSENFECGLCEYKAQDLEELELHLFTCEIYECYKCELRVKKLSDMKRHKDENHVNFGVWITHAKLDRKNKEIVKTSEEWSSDLFREK